MKWFLALGIPVWPKKWSPGKSDPQDQTDWSTDYVVQKTCYTTVIHMPILNWSNTFEELYRMFICLEHVWYRRFSRIHIIWVYHVLNHVGFWRRFERCFSHHQASVNGMEFGIFARRAMVDQAREGLCYQWKT